MACEITLIANRHIYRCIKTCVVIYFRTSITTKENERWLCGNPKKANKKPKNNVG
jgi:hypothetical protein